MTPQARAAGPSLVDSGFHKRAGLRGPAQTLAGGQLEHRDASSRSPVWTPSMPLVVLPCTLLCALMAGSACACALKNHTLWLERQDCAQCVAINTTICSGYCHTQDTNLRGRFSRTFMIQRSCVPVSLVYRAACMPGCPRDASPQLYYPVARGCGCRRCDTRTHRCVRTGRLSHEPCSTAARNQSRPAEQT